MKLTSTKFSKEEFERLWEDANTDKKEGIGHVESDEGTRFLFVRDDETGAVCCYAHPKKADTATFVRDVKLLKEVGIFEFYYTPKLHGGIRSDKSNKEVISLLRNVIKPKEKEDREALLAVYKRLRGTNKTTSSAFTAPAPMAGNSAPAARTGPAQIGPNAENNGKDDGENEVVPTKKKSGCFVKLAAAGAAVALALGLGYSAYKLGQRNAGKEPVGTTKYEETTAPEDTDSLISGDSVVVEQVEINDEIKDEIYNAIVKNVDVKLDKEEITSTFISQDQQVVFAMTETGLYKIDLTNGGQNVGEVTTNDELIAKLQNTAAVTESYNVDYLLGDKYADVCAEFAENYQNENTVTSAQAFVSEIALKKSADGKGFEVAPTATVFSVDAQGNANFEEYSSDRVSVQRGVQLSGIDMVAASLFSDLGFTTDIYTIEDVEKVSENYEVTLSEVNQTETTPETEIETELETEPVQTTPETEPETEESTTVETDEELVM